MHHPGWSDLDTSAEDAMLRAAREDRYSQHAYEQLWQENINLREEVRRLTVRLDAALQEMEKARRLVGGR